MCQSPLRKHPGGPVGFALAAAAALLAVVAVPGCSSSSSGGAPDSGDDSQYYSTPPGDGSPETEGSSDAAAEAHVCKVPPGATSVTQSEAGPLGCNAVASNTICDPTGYRLICTGPDPSLVPPPDSSWQCGLMPTNDPTRLIYCCPCQ